MRFVSGNISLDFSTLEEAVYQLLMMESYAQEVSGRLSMAVELISEMPVKGNFNDIVVATGSEKGLGKGNWGVGGQHKLALEVVQEEIVYEYNNSIAKTKSEGGSSDSVIGIARIVLKIRDLCTLIEFTHQLISRTEIEMSDVDKIVARLALDMHLKRTDIPKEEREYLEKNYASIHSDLTKDAEEARKEREDAIDYMEEQYASSEEEIGMEDISNDEQPL